MFSRARQRGRRHGQRTARSARPHFDEAAYLRNLLKAALAACGGAGRTASVEIETTLHEIVELSPVTLDGADDAKLTACVSERLWNSALPRAFLQESAVFPSTAEPSHSSSGPGTIASNAEAGTSFNGSMSSSVQPLCASPWK